MKKFLLEDDIIITDIVLAINVKTDTSNHIHNDRASHGFAYIFSSKEYIFNNGKTISVDLGDIIYLPKHSSYVVNNITPGDCYAINFQLSSGLHYEPFKIRVTRQEEIVSLFKSTINHYSSREPGAKEACISKLYSLIYQIKRDYYTSYTTSHQRKLIKPALDHIEKHYRTSAILVSDLARMCGISEVYLRKIFRKEFGKTPVEYINALRLSFAKDLLRYGNYSVKEACFLSGFNDESYFSRAFRRRYGKPPVSFVKN
ncbi:MAG TPA: AraC family transcriptional regulator [Candidatus Avimonas sp.]|jgi:AraC-like DNA-binding protein|nr:AraC family transcriptional regulator [Candidatus Avimonas sp.]HQA16565.1 AraC family transcriptional regulator [Candidatus Avimonas sp.]HQD38601.1 AraC family transcriptional regulator [Candidatus Avimonas sp.]